MALRSTPAVVTNLSCLLHFPTIPPCSTKVDVLETRDVPFLLSLLDEKLGDHC